MQVLVDCEVSQDLAVEFLLILVVAQGSHLQEMALVLVVYWDEPF